MCVVSRRQAARRIPRQDPTARAARTGRKRNRVHMRGMRRRQSRHFHGFATSAPAEFGREINFRGSVVFGVWVGRGSSIRGCELISRAHAAARCGCQRSSSSPKMHLRVRSKRVPPSGVSPPTRDVLNCNPIQAEVAGTCSRSTSLRHETLWNYNT